MEEITKISSVNIKTINAQAGRHFFAQRLCDHKAKTVYCCEGNSYPLYEPPKAVSALKFLIKLLTATVVTD